MAKILVADDDIELELLIKQRFRRQIRDRTYEFIYVSNGIDAWNALKMHPDVDMVLSDINMPEMDGLTLLSKTVETYPMIKTVMASAYGDMESIRTAMNRGAFDFIIKPVNFQDLELTIEKTTKHVNQLKETLRALKENEILRMHVDEKVLKSLDNRSFETSLPPFETIEATVGFLGLCGFSTLSDVGPIDKVVPLLNKYFDIILKEILAQGGYVDNFVNNDIMAVFHGDYHLDRAIEASLAVRIQIEKSYAEINDNILPKISVGIDSGEVMRGQIGPVNLRRLDHSVVGNVVDNARHLQSAAAEGQILLGETSYQEVKEYFSCKKVVKMKVKNKRHPLIAAYEVLH